MNHTLNLQERVMDNISEDASIYISKIGLMPQQSTMEAIKTTR